VCKYFMSIFYPHASHLGVASERFRTPAVQMVSELCRHSTFHFTQTTSLYPYSWPAALSPSGFDACPSLTLGFSSCFLQVYPNYVPGDPESEAEGTPAAFLLGYDVRICRRKYVAPPGNFPRERPSTGATALHNDPKEPCRNITM